MSVVGRNTYKVGSQSGESGPLVLNKEGKK